jgi:hypothetical protein
MTCGTLACALSRCALSRQFLTCEPLAPLEPTCLCTSLVLVTPCPDSSGAAVHCGCAVPVQRDSQHGAWAVQGRDL